jgi:hypothetical protein
MKVVLAGIALLVLGEFIHLVSANWFTAWFAQVP